MDSSPTSTAPADTLLELELRIARRADELTREKMATGTLNLQCWLVAEYEVLGRDEHKIVPFPGAVRPVSQTDAAAKTTTLTTP